MKQLFAGFFAVYFFIGGLYPHTDFAQLWHTASAFKHFKLHQEEARTLGNQCTIWTFIKDHYINPESHQHNNLGDHDHLPAKHLHHALDLIVFEFWPGHTGSDVLLTRTSIDFVNSEYSFHFHPGIDRPPSLI